MSGVVIEDFGNEIFFGKIAVFNVEIKGEKVLVLKGYEANTGETDLTFDEAITAFEKILKFLKDRRDVEFNT